MNWLEMLQKIFEVCIIPLLGVLTTYLVMFIKNKSAALQEQTDNELYKKYIALLDETITKCVIATNQTYVESLKDKNAFDIEAQKKAFEMTYQSVLAILSKDAQQYLNEAVGDLNAYIVKSIEAQVNANKVVKAAPELPAVNE